jgi:hypothetical protein
MSLPTNNWGKRSVRLYPQLFVEGLMSYLECSVHLSHQLFVGGLMSYLGCSVHLFSQLLTEHPN